MIKWSMISRLGKNKVINQAYIYLIIVPILAKFLSRINNPLIFSLGEEDLHFVFELPFAWKLFYFSAIIFTIASALYSWWAPKVIVENESFGEFMRQRKNFTHLIDYLANLGITKKFVSFSGLNEGLLLSDDSIPISSLLKNFVKGGQQSKKEIREYHIRLRKLELYKLVFKMMESFRGKYIKPREFKQMQDLPQEVVVNDYEDDFYLEQAFWGVYQFANTYKRKRLITVTFLYSLGFILILIVFIQNIYTVITL